MGLAIQLAENHLALLEQPLQQSSVREKEWDVIKSQNNEGLKHLKFKWKVKETIKIVR